MRLFSFFRTLGAPALPGLLLAACILGDDEEKSSPYHGSRGSVRFEIRLERNQSLLLKSSSADTAFHLDSLLVMLTAPGQDTIREAYAISGRADTGTIALPPLTYALQPLRSWKATFATIDTLAFPALRRDTVHWDSVIFDVALGDTILVAPVLNPRYSILRARLLSTNGDSIPNQVVYVRLRVDGIVQDSLPVGGANATLRWIQAMSGSILHAAGDSGRILRSTNDGLLWTEQSFGTDRMVGGHFPTSDHGYVLSALGRTYKTEDGGASWSTRAITADSVNSVTFISSSTGFAVGKGGGVYKTENDGNSWFTLVSNTPQQVNGVSFPSPDVGYVVGDNETILKTVNGSAQGGSPPENGGIVWSPVAGGWFVQTSGTTQDVNTIAFTSASRGWAMGKAGTIRLTTNGGATWSSRSGAGSGDLNAVWFTGSASAILVGNTGAIFHYGNENYWQAQTSNTTQHLYDVRFAGTDTAYVAGAGGTLLRTVNGSQTSYPYATWTAQTIPAAGGDAPWSSQNLGSAALNAVQFSGTTGWTVGADGAAFKTTNAGQSWNPVTSGVSDTLHALHFANASNGVAVGSSEIILRTENGGDDWVASPDFGWLAQTSGISSPNALHSVHFINLTTGWAVADSGKILRTTNRGESWDLQANDKKKPLRGVYAATTNIVVAAGDSGIVKRTTNGGTSWTTILASSGSDLHGAWVNAAADRYYVVGASGVIRRSTNGTTWTSQTSGTTNTLNAVHSNNSRVWVVGDGGVIRYRTSTGSGSFSTSNSGVTTGLNGVYGRSNTVAIAVGDGGLILKTTNTGSSWVRKDSGETTQDLNHVFFTGATDTGYAVGSGGTILKTADGGENWFAVSSGTTADLRGVYVAAGSQDTVYAVGSAGTIRKTVNGGSWWSNKGGPMTLRGAYFPSAAIGFSVGDSGTLLRTLNGGAAWRARIPITSKRLNGVSGFSTTKLLVVGDAGVVLRSANPTAANPTFTLPAQGATAERLNAVALTSANIAVAVGDNGTIIKCSNSANDNWAIKGAGLTSANLTHIRFTGTSTAYATGADGTILKTINAGETWSLLSSGFGEPLNGVYPQSGDSVVVVGGNGKVFKTATGGSPTASTAALRSVHPITSTTVYVAGAAGTLAKTTNAGGTWTLQTSGTANDLNGVHFWTPGTGYAVGNSGTILKTTDGGANWITQASNTTQHLRSVQAVSADTAYATGSTGIMLRTIDGGVTWYQQETPYGDQINRVYFYSPIYGYAVGNGGRIYNAVNQGDNWTGGGIKRNLKGVYFISPDTGWIVGEDEVILKTVDGGIFWSQQHIDNAGGTLHGIDFVSSDTGWVSGDNGLILKTVNGGATWSPQYTGESVSLRWINLRNQNRGFAIGGTESLLQTENGGATWGGHFVGALGAKIFDRMLTYKYLTPNQSHSIMLEAIDRLELPLRGYQASLNLNLAPAQDSTFTVNIARCGYESTPDCLPL